MQRVPRGDALELARYRVSVSYSPQHRCSGINRQASGRAMLMHGMWTGVGTGVDTWWFDWSFSFFGRVYIPQAAP